MKVGDRLGIFRKGKEIRDPATGKVRATVEVDTYAAAVVITPNGKTAYGAAFASSMITPVSTATDKAGKQIGVGPGPYPDTMAITPDGKTLYVAAYNSNQLVPISTATNKPGKAIHVGREPVAVAITP